MRRRAALILALACVAAGCGGSGTKHVLPASSVPTTRPAVPSAFTDKVTNDDLNTPTLNRSVWDFVDPNADSNVLMDGTHAVISVPAGSDTATHDPNDHGDRAPRLMQAITPGDFSFDAKFDSQVARQFQQQGVVVEQDATHYLYAKVVQNLFQTSFVVQVVSGTAISTPTNASIYNRPSMILRVAHRGTNWSVGYSYDGLYWTAASSFAADVTPQRVGIFGGNAGNTAPPFSAKVDSFLNTERSTDPPIINFWYGVNQAFGTHGQPQQWANVLGDVVDPSGTYRLTYSLNDGTDQPLSLGENAVRLAAPGDFNVEIDYLQLHYGSNTIKLTAVDNDGNVSTKSVTVNKAVDKLWPLPYTANWSVAGGNADNIAQVADGHWVVQSDGTIRNQDIGYDRLVLIGQASSWSQYTATAPVTIHSMDPDSSAVGLITGFTGATSDLNGTPNPDQPRSGHPFPAAFLFDQSGGRRAHVEIYANSSSHVEQTLIADKSGTQLELEVPYTFKASATDNGAGGSLFRFKIWKTGTAEPAAWLLEANGDLNQGSVALVAHRADVSFGTVVITHQP